MSDSNTTVFELRESVRIFCEERDWDKYHNPKDLAIGAITEASELLEHFRFKSVDEAERMMRDARTRTVISGEIADVLFFLIRLCQKYDVDMSSALRAKIETNAIRYSVNKAKGSNKKYSEL